MSNPGKGQYNRPKFGTKDAEILKINATALMTLRKKRNLSRTQLAEQVGVSMENIARIEKGQGGTYRATAVRLAKVLKTNLPQFVAKAA